MKNKILTTITCLAVALGFMSCDDTFSPKLEKEGTLCLSKMGVEVKDASRADINVAPFLVSIAKGEENVADYVYSEMPEIVTLTEGTYKLTVRSHKVEKAAWEKPYYLGTENFTIKSGQITEIGTVTCSFANVAVTIKYDTELLAVMDEDCKVTVVVNDDGNLAFGKAETRTGYFEAVEGSTTLVATFEGKVDGNNRRMQQSYTDVNPGQHYTITYSLHTGDNNPPVTPPVDPNNTGTITTVVDSESGISIDTFVSTGVDEELTGGYDASGDNTDEEVIINPGVEPGTEPNQGGNDPQPGGDTITFQTSPSINLDIENSVDVPDAIVYLHSDNGFAHLNVVISSDNADFLASAGELMPLSFDLATITGDDADNLASVGLPVGPYPGETDIEFNVSDLVGLLGAFPGHHAFHLTVVDDNGAEKSITLKFVAE